MRNIDTIVNAYLVCALWSSTDEDGTPLDEDHDTDDINADSVKAAREVCEDMLHYIEREGIDAEAWTDSGLGHDLWLTRNHHGAGFWDRGHGKPGEQLTEYAHGHGESDAYVGDDGKVYLT